MTNASLLLFHRWPNSAACSSLLRVSPSAAWWTTTALPSRSRVALSVLPSSNTPSPPFYPFCPVALSLPPPFSQSYLFCSAPQSTHVSLCPIFLKKWNSCGPLLFHVGRSSCEMKHLPYLDLCFLMYVMSQHRFHVIIYFKRQALHDGYGTFTRIQHLVPMLSET